MATTGAASDSIFIDTNILIFAMVQTAPFHGAATARLASLQSAGTELWVSRQILREYLAALSRPQTYTPPLPTPSLIADVTQFEAQFRIAEDDRTVTGLLLSILANIPVGGRQIYDANIVATMLARGIPNLLTHNVSDFARFAGRIAVLPL